ncbi:MFS transporter [Siccirubricoccus sp. KC 17139]|uniref:MFS transporter n=1 Tax=Siccirubricoccus soli TaxID=2899147 RepID=A0ABT1D4D3_9PROT|nr:MFS transporter [Siccirubricoccus soli]MCO6416140.1 MFS transporter [Siccirubricoccus soli]MCP2682274.1 MFS transporter [Siccirubricoccus soli]
MSATAPEKRNVALLAASQALFQTTSVLIMTVGGLAGHMLATDKGLATLPIAASTVGTAIATVPASLLMARVGRKPGFLVGTLLGAAGGALGVAGLLLGSFWLFCLAHVLAGAYQGFAQFYRFAAADAASDVFRSRAISLVMAGGVFAAFAGPGLASLTRDLSLGAPFVASYAGIIAVSLVATALVSLIQVPPPAAQSVREAPRPLSVIARQPAFLVALGGAAVGYGAMIMAMTATPLAMVGHHHDVADAASVIRWHVLGMFVPSFFTGALIARFGAPTMMLAGMALLAAHATVAVSGVDLLHFSSALVLLGVGWNFSYIGGTSLLTETYRPSEKAKVQAANDFLILGVVVAASFASGGLLHRLGWDGVNLTILPFLGAAVIALGTFLLRRRLRPRAAQPI